MAMSQNSKPGFNGTRDLISLSLGPVRQSLRFYAEIQRSALDTFTRFSAMGTHPLLSAFGGSSERNGEAIGIGAAVEPRTKPVTRSSKPAAKPAATKRPAAAKPAAPKRPAAAKPAATKRPAVAKPGVAKPAATKIAAAKPAVKSAAPARKATAQKASAKKVASSPSRPRSARTGGAKKA